LGRRDRRLELAVRRQRFEEAAAKLGALVAGKLSRLDRVFGLVRVEAALAQTGP